MSKYEQEREANIKRIQDVFESLGITVLHETVSSVLPKENVGKRKILEFDKPESDIDYDPTSDLDNQSDSDDDESDIDYNDDLNTEVRWLSRSLNTLALLYFFLVYLFYACICVKYFIDLFNCIYSSVFILCLYSSVVYALNTPNIMHTVMGDLIVIQHFRYSKINNLRIISESKRTLLGFISIWAMPCSSQTIFILVYISYACILVYLFYASIYVQFYLIYRLLVSLAR